MVDYPFLDRGGFLDPEKVLDAAYESLFNMEIIVDPPTADGRSMDINHMQVYDPDFYYVWLNYTNYCMAKAFHYNKGSGEYYIITTDFYLMLHNLIGWKRGPYLDWSIKEDPDLLSYLEMPPTDKLLTQVFCDTVWNITNNAPYAALELVRNYVPIDFDNPEKGAK